MRELRNPKAAYLVGQTRNSGRAEQPVLRHPYDLGQISLLVMWGEVIRVTGRFKVGGVRVSPVQARGYVELGRLDPAVEANAMKRQGLDMARGG